MKHKSNGSAPPWQKVTACFVRAKAGGSGKGNLVGCLKDVDGDLYFAYSPWYVMNALSAPLCLDGLPLSVGWQRVGDSNLFSARRPSEAVQQLVYPYVASVLSGKPITACLEAKPLNLVTELVWASMMQTLVTGVDGLFFDPVIQYAPRIQAAFDLAPWWAEGWPKASGSTESSVWGPLLGKRQSLIPSARLMMVMRKSSGAQLEDSDGEYLQHAIPWSRPYLWIRDSDEFGARATTLPPHQLEMGAYDYLVSVAYSHVAQKGGLNVEALQVGPTSGSIVPIGSRVKGCPPSAFWRSESPHFLERPDFASSAGKVFKQKGSTRRPYLAEPMGRQKGIYIGRCPAHAYATLARSCRKQGVAFDGAEFFRRFAFLRLAGVFMHEIPPINYTLRVDESLPFQGHRDQVRLELAPMVIGSPLYCPYTTAVSMRSWLIRGLYRYFKHFEIHQAQGEFILKNIISALKTAAADFKAVVPPGDEACALPVIWRPAPKADGDGRLQDRPVRQPSVSTSINWAEVMHRD